jgi:hypothetical protein
MDYRRATKSPDQLLEIERERERERERETKTKRGRERAWHIDL